MSEAWISRYKRHGFPKEKVIIINKETPEESTKQKKVIEMGTPEEYIQQKHAINGPWKRQVPKNKKTSINYASTGDIWDRNNIIVDDIFDFIVVLEIIRSDEDPKPQTIEECQYRHN